MAQHNKCEYQRAEKVKIALSISQLNINPSQNTPRTPQKSRLTYEYQRKIQPKSKKKTPVA
jgi:hypothetical protein